MIFSLVICITGTPIATTGVLAGEKPASFVIVDSEVADGTGAALRRVNVRVAGDRIVRVGRFAPQAGERVVPAAGLVLAPGFIDIHNHSTEGIEEQPLAATQISQGITTVLLGQDGGSPWPIGAWLDARWRDPPALNVLLLVGHATLRQIVMGKDYRREARPEEIAQMARLVEQGMREGAVGLSSGLEYVVGSYAATGEVVAMARAAARSSGFYISHLRDEADKSFEAMRELLSIGRRAKIPVQNTHIKLGTRGVWGKAADVIRMYDEARKSGIDITADCYPYDAWHSNLKVLVPSKRWADPADVREGLEDIGGAGNVLITRHPPHPEYVGRTLEEIARSRSMAPEQLYIEMVKDGDAGVIGKSMIEPDIKTLYQWRWTMVASDGGIGMPHPRAAGTYPRILGRYVRELHWLSLPEAVRKMTSLPAWRLQIPERGIIRKGNFADLVLFNPATVIDRATFQEPYKVSEGIEKVWVNGSLVWDKGNPTGARPGRILSRKGRDHAASR